MAVRARTQLATWNLGRSTETARSGLAIGRIVLIALATTVAQVAFAMGIAVATGAAQKSGVYESLCRWDGNLYVQITQRGYHGAPPGNPVDFQLSNVAFFPGYPLAARGLHAALGGAISFQASMVLAAQLAAWGFWTYWLLFFRRCGVPRPLAIGATAIALAHPAGFFLVVAYSESLFLVGLLGFLYWVSAGNARGWLLAAGHGLVMTATRLGGLPVAFCPLAAQMLIETTTRSATTSIVDRLRAEWPALTRLALVGGIASLGALGFFAYCQWQFGDWDLYMQTQKAGWNVHADWLWLVRPVNYVFFASTWHPNVLWPDDLSRLCVLASMLVIAVLLRHEVRAARAGSVDWQPRAVLYLAAGTLFFLHAAGVSPILMKSMVRYCFGVHALLLLAAVHLCRDWPPATWSRRRLAWMSLVTASALVVQVALAWRFFTNQWVA